MNSKPKPHACSVLIVSSSDRITDFLTELLPPSQFYPVHTVKSAGEAKRSMLEMQRDIVIINTPLPDEYGVQLAADLSVDSAVGVLLLVKEEVFEQTCYRVENCGVFTVQKPNSRQYVLGAVRLLAAAQAKLRAMEKKAISLQEKMDEIRLVNRAKWILIDRLKMSEADAHRYIEKQAMDLCVKRKEIAENIIRTYEI